MKIITREITRIEDYIESNGLTLIAGRPHVGKTTFALSQARRMAMASQIPVAFFSLEMTKWKLIEKLIPTTDNELKSLMEAPLYIDDTPNISVSDLRNEILRLVEVHGIKMVFVDYLQLMDTNDIVSSSRQMKISVCLHSLKELADNLGISIIVIYQTSRMINGSDNSIEWRSNFRELDLCSLERDVKTIMLF